MQAGTWATRRRLERNSKLSTGDRHNQPVGLFATISAGVKSEIMNVARLIVINIVFLAATCTLAQQGAKSGKNRTCTGVINTRVVSTLSIDEISRLGDAVSLQNSFGGLTFRPFDDDDRPRPGKEIEIGFILARSGDLGGNPVGLVIWSERNLNFNFRKSPGGAIFVESTDLNNCHVLATFTFNEKGYVLRDNKAIAQVH